MSAENQSKPVVLITGAARRVGASMVDVFHQHGYRVIVHYRHSREEAQVLVEKFNTQQANTAIALSADLDDHTQPEKLIQESIKVWGQLDILINNASTFFATPMGGTKSSDWNCLLSSNLIAPFLLSQAAAPYLKKQKGSIINITDIHAKKPMKNHTAYSCAKAGLAMLTQSLALELAPDIRVNAIAPGSVIWPEGKNTMTEETKQKILSQTLLQKQVDPNHIAKTALFLAQNPSITGQTITVDGGAGV